MLLFTDGFDHYSTTELAKKWDGISGTCDIASVGRSSTSGLRLGNGYVFKNITPSTTVIVGMALYITALNNNPFEVRFVDATTGTDIQCYFNINPVDGRGRFYGPGGLLGTTVDAFAVTTYGYLEIEATIDNSVGTVEIRFNGITQLSLTGVDTQATIRSTSNQVLLFSSSNSYKYIDDLYICDGTGTKNNTFIGDIKVETLFATGDGTYGEWAVSSGSNPHYTYIDDNPPNDDTDFITTSGVGFVDTFSMSNLLTASGTILGLQMNIYAKKDDAGSRIISPIQYIGGTLYSGVVIGLTNTYLFYCRPYDENPDTGDYFTITEIDSGIEFGVKLES